MTADTDIWVKADPTSVLDYAVDWASKGWLADGETITNSTWAVPAGITQTVPAPSIAAGKTTIWMTGGTVGETYRITNHITTSAGRQDKRSINIQVEDR